MTNCTISINTLREYLREQNDPVIINLTSQHIIKISIVAIACIGLISYNFMCISRKEMHGINEKLIEQVGRIAALKSENKNIKESFIAYKKFIFDAKIADEKKKKEGESKIVKWIKNSVLVTQGLQFVNIVHVIASKILKGK